MEVLPPFIVNTAALTGVGQLPKFAADMFHLEGTDLWLTPTAEVELTSLHRDETLDADVLPVKLCAWTACFRSEAGAAGKDTRGLKRQHQFQKVENVQIHAPGRKLRGARIASGQCGKRPSKTRVCIIASCICARETWASHHLRRMTLRCGSPSTNEFMEISSCSNTEAFQARRSSLFASSRKAAKANSYTHSTAQDWP